MKTELKRNIDVDSSVLETPDGEIIRDRPEFIAGAESTGTLGKDSDRGRDATARVKTYMRAGKEVTLRDGEVKTGMFGRQLTDATAEFNGKTVKVNALKAMLGDAAYYVKYGKAQGDTHDALKTTYNTYLPYQFSDERQDLSEDRYKEIAQKMPQIQGLIENMKGGKGDKILEQQLDTLIGDVFGDGGEMDVAAFLEIQKKKELDLDRSNQPMSADKLIYEAFQDPRMQVEWDRSVLARTNRDDVRLAYKGKKTFMEKAGATMQLFNDVANVADRYELWNTQFKELENSDELLEEGMQEIPSSYRGAVTEEAKKYGNARALMKIEQLKEDIADNTVYDDMGLVSKFGFGTVAMVSSPSSLFVAAKGAQLGLKATKAIRLWESTKLAKGGAMTAAWTAVAGADAITMNGPRIIGDQTYTPRDMLLDVALDTAAGVALPMSVIVGKSVVSPFVKRLADSRAKSIIDREAKLTKELKNEHTKATTEDTNTQQILQGAEAHGKDRKAAVIAKTETTGQGEAAVTVKKGADVGEETIEKTEIIHVGDRPVIHETPWTTKDHTTTGEIDVETSLQYGEDANGKPFGWLDEGESGPMTRDEQDMFNDWQGRDQMAQNDEFYAQNQFLSDVDKGIDALSEGEAEIIIKGSTNTRSTAIGRWKEGFESWTQRDYTAAKKAKVQLQDRANWTDKQKQKFDKEYEKVPEGDISPAELEVIASQERAEDLIEGGWLKSGLDEMHTKAKEAFGVLGKIGQHIGNLTGKAMSHSLQQSDNAVMRFVGHNFLEDPTGYAGNLKRHTTAGMRAVNEKNIAMSQIMPNYANNIDEWAKGKGANFYERLKATWGTPDGNKMAKHFEDEFIDAINARKMGKKGADIDPHVSKMLDDWQKFTDFAGNRAKTAKLPGWGKLRTNYFPQLRDNQKMANVIRKEGVTAISDLERMFEIGMKNTRETGLHDMTDEEIVDLAKTMVKQAELGQKNLPDSTSSKLGRAQSRVEMDWSAEFNGKKLKDYLQTDIAMTADKYTSDLSGRLAMNHVTAGKITTDADLKGLMDVAHGKHAEAMKKLVDAGQHRKALKLDKAFANETKMMEDTFNMVLGRPPRGGLPAELRHLKQFTMLTRMGILGTSQSIETGNIIARNTIDLFSDHAVLKHMLSMDPNTPKGRALLDDITNITGRTKDMEYLHRPQQVLDEAALESYSNLRQMTTMLADKMTGGHLKQPASRLLGKSSMFNWVQKNQSEFVQKSFLIHTDRYFTTGKSSINPKRMVDLGLINRDGTNTELSHVFNNVVKKDKNGHIVDLQWKKWSKSAKEQYMDAAQRDEAQRLQQTFAGEAPAYYNKPLMNLLFQFREVPLVAQNKQLARNLAFGDVEAVSSVMLNLAIAGMVRFGWLGGIGYAKAVAEGETDNYQLPGLDRLDIARYLAAGGLIPDAVSIANSGFHAYNDKDVNRIGRELPAYGLIQDYGTVGMGVAQGDLPKVAEAIQGLTMLGNTGYMDVIHTMLVKNIEEMDTFAGKEE